MNIPRIALAVVLACSPVAANPVHEAQNTLISDIDRSLPRITLRYFLEYETGAAIEWAEVACGRGAGDPGACVRASATMRDGWTVILVVRLGSDRQAPRVRSVHVVADDGTAVGVSLRELPARLHGRPLRKPPRDLPLPPSKQAKW